MSLGTGGLPSASCVQMVMKAYEKCVRDVDKLTPPPDMKRSDSLERVLEQTIEYDQCAKYRDDLLRSCIVKNHN